MDNQQSFLPPEPEPERKFSFDDCLTEEDKRYLKNVKKYHHREDPPTSVKAAEKIIKKKNKKDEE